MTRIRIMALLIPQEGPGQSPPRPFSREKHRETARTNNLAGVIMQILFQDATHPITLNLRFGWSNHGSAPPPA